MTHFRGCSELNGVEVNHVDKQAIERIAKEYEIGRIGTEEFFGMMDEIFKGKFTREKLENAWNAIVVEENSAIIPIVDAIQARYQTAILSNTNPSPFPGIVRYRGNRQKVFQIISLFSNRSLPSRTRRCISMLFAICRPIRLPFFSLMILPKMSRLP